MHSNNVDVGTRSLDAHSDERSSFALTPTTALPPWCHTPLHAVLCIRDDPVRTQSHDLLGILADADLSWVLRCHPKCHSLAVSTQRQHAKTATNSKVGSMQTTTWSGI